MTAKDTVYHSADCDANGKETIMVADTDYGGHLCPVCEPGEIALLGNTDAREGRA